MATVHRTYPSVIGMTLERDFDDEPDEREELARERGEHNLPPREALLDPESLEALGVDLEEGRRLYADMCGALGNLLATGQSVEVLGFGKFLVKPYRPAIPARSGDHSFVEAPYLGPIEFIPSALLQRQVDTRQLDATLVTRCDALFAALREDPRMPRGKIPLLIKGTFRAVAAVLIVHHIVEMPGVGYLVSRPRPNQIKIDYSSGEVKTLTGFQAILLRPSPALIERIPGRVILKEPTAPLPPPPLLHVDSEFEPEE